MPIMPAMGEGRVDVVIVNWNAGPQLRDCLASLAASAEAGRLRVVVVDNASTDGSADCLDPDALDPPGLDLTVLRNSGNVGFARACNQGAAIGRADTVLFLNPDTRVGRDGIVRARAALDARPKAGIVGARLVDAGGATHRTCAPTPTAFGLIAQAMLLDRLLPGLVPRQFMDAWDHADSRCVEAVMGAFLMIRRPVFAALRGFDERFFVYFEDADLCARTRSAGHGVRHVAEAVVEHRGQGTTAQVKDRRLFYFLSSQTRYARKHHGRAAALAVLAGAFLVQLPLRFLHALARRAPGEAGAVRRAALWLFGAAPRLLRAGNAG